MHPNSFISTQTPNNLIISKSNDKFLRIVNQKLKYFRYSERTTENLPLY